MYLNKLGTSSTSMSTSRIRTLTVSVTDRYLLETPSVTAVKSRMRSTSLAGMEVQVKPTRGRQTSVGHTAGGSGSGSSLGQSGASALKDVKKFMKRFPRLANLALVGKGETGRWKAVRCAAKDIAVTFLPVFTGHDGGERSDRLLQLQAPFFGPVLRSLGLDIMRRIQHHSPVSLQEASLASSATSSSIATILSTSSSETALSSLTTVVTSGGVSPKAEMPPLAKVGKAHVADSPAKSVNKAPGTSGGLTTQVKSSAMKQQNFSSIVQKEPSPSPGNTSPVRVLQSPPSEKRIHRDG